MINRRVFTDKLIIHKEAPPLNLRATYMEDISKPPLGQTLGNRTIVTRRTYTLEFKLGVLEWMNTHKSSIRAAARRFDVHRRMIQRWSEGEAELNEAVMTSGAQRRKIRSGRPPLSDELEEKLIQWFDSQKDFGVLVSDRDLQRQALAIANDINLENFKASSMWVKAWKRRHGVSSNHGNNERDVTIPTKTSNPQTSRLCGDALLTHTNPRDTIHLIFEEGETNIATPTNDLVYLDYDTPEHNYCKLNHNYFTSSSMIEEEGSEMVHELLKGWDDMKHYEIVILDGEDEKVLYCV